MTGVGDGVNGDTGSEDQMMVDAGATLFSSQHNTAGGAMLSCSSCHGPDGSGDFGPDIRGEPGDHLQEHAQEDGRHPEGVKFLDLTSEDFDAIAVFLGGEPGGDDDGEFDENVLPGDADNGASLFAAAQTTVNAAQIACANCHGSDGSGDSGPDIRGEAGSHLQEHAQDSGRHPEDFKFPELTAQDFEDMAAFLASVSE